MWAMVVAMRASVEYSPERVWVPWYCVLPDVEE
jgi:hypothetical protein